MEKRKSSNTGSTAIDWNESSVQREDDSEKHNSIVNMQRVSINHPSVGHKQGSNVKPGKISVANKVGDGKTLNITVMRNQK